MKKIINTFKYGSGETKRLLAITFLTGFAAIGFVVTAILTNILLFFFGAVISVFITISLAQTFGIKENSTDSLPPMAPMSDGSANASEAQVQEQEVFDEEALALPELTPMLSEEEISSKIKVKATKLPKIKQAKKVDRSKGIAKQPKTKKVKASKSVVKVAKKRKAKREKAVQYVMEQQQQRRSAEEVKLERMRLAKSKAAKAEGTLRKAPEKKKYTPDRELPKQQKQSAKPKEKEQPEKAMDDPFGIFGDGQQDNQVGDGVQATANLIDMSDITGGAASSKPIKELSEEEKQEELQANQASDEELAQYNKVKVKKMLRKYKVKREHRLVIIDRCEKHSIYQTPAYIWLADNLFHMLLIESEPRHLTIPVFKITEVDYLKKQIANEDVDYAAFKGKSMLAELFRPYLPDYTHSTVMDDLSAYKNLYGIGPGVYFTNRSASSLFDLLTVEFAVDDKVTMSSKVNVFFKDAYKANIMLRDSVIDANGYADRISSILDSMAHSTIAYEEFKDTLNLMQKNKLITAEFAMYYMGVRDKL